MSENWYTDYQQNKRLRGLQDDLDHVSSSLAAARSSQNRLRAELSKVQGSLEQRLDRLSSAFDAFVEISDLRVTLGLFDAHGRVRHQAKQLVAGENVLGAVTDVDGYWLPPALIALQGVADGVVDTDALDAATTRDARRTAVLHVLGAAVLGGRQTVPASTLADTFPELTGSVPRFQRAAWTLAADGFFGEAGWELARRRCVDLVRGLPADALVSLRDVAAPTGVAPVPRELEGATELGAALQACARLSALREWVTAALAGYTGEPASDQDPLVRSTLQLLIDEGSPIELPLLVRERELRAVIEGNSAEVSAWDGPVGDAVELLRTDAVLAEHPNRRALAVRACAEPLVAIADGFAVAARLPVPDRTSARTRYGQVIVTKDGAEPESVREAVGRVERSGQVESQRRLIACGAVATGVLFLVLAVVAGWGWVLAAVAAFGVAGYQWLTDARERRDAAASRAANEKSLLGEIDSRTAAFRRVRAELADRRIGVDADLEALRAALG